MFDGVSETMEIDNCWNDFLYNELESNYMQNLKMFLAREYKGYNVFPPKEDIFNAFAFTSPEDIKVVIIGQDPYPTKGNAMGLAFSVQPDVKIPASLKNIFLEIQNEFGTDYPCNGDLTRWAKQGVFLLNTILTVREGQPNSHKNVGWETFTDKVITYLDLYDTPKVFMLWGNNAKSKKQLIQDKAHLVLESAHPSPLSARNGFFGNGHFKKANKFLVAQGMQPIQW